MKVTELGIRGVKVLEPKYFEDYRGYYCETYSARTLKELGIETVFVQDNHIFSKKKGTIRGIHFQNNPKAQAKLCRCTRGAVMDVAIDLRKGSKSFKKWIAVELSAENKRQLFIPAGFGHGVLSLVDNCEFQYKVDNFYEPSLDRAIKWNDPEIDVNWGVTKPVISPKDMDAPLLKNSDVNFVWE